MKIIIETKKKDIIHEIIQQTIELKQNNNNEMLTYFINLYLILMNYLGDELFVEELVNELLFTSSLSKFIELLKKQLEYNDLGELDDLGELGDLGDSKFD